MKKSVWMCLSLCVLAGQAAALDLHGLRPDEIALWAAPVENKVELLAHRADAPVNPASTMKLVTSWAALEILRPTYRWTTRLVSDAPVVDGALKGDLYWIGAGDPRFSEADLSLLLRDLRLRGVRRIEGRLMLDKSVFGQLSNADGFEEDEGKTFTVGPDSHLTGLKVAWLRFFNDENGARVVLDPPLPGISVNSALRPGGNESCKDVRQWASIRQEGDKVSISGVLPRACDGARAYLNVLDHNSFANQSFSAWWQEQGGAGPQGFGVGTAPAGARELASHQSEPMTAALADMNKYSNNTMARTLFLTIGHEAGGDNPVADAGKAVRQLLASRQIDASALVLENGSGLSRRERVTARMLGEVLRDAARGPYGGELIASLPIASEDGTLKKRFAVWGPRIRMKTGTLKNVKALAGYWQAADGRRLALVAIVNSPRALEMGAALDAVVGDAIRQFDSSAQ